MSVHQQLRDNRDAIATRVEANIKTMLATLNTQVSQGDINGAQQQLLDLTAIIGLSAETQADAKQMLEMARLVSLNKNADKGYSATILGKLLTAECHKYEGLYEKADRVNSAVVHAIDGMRTIISLYKTEMDLSRWQES